MSIASSSFDEWTAQDGTKRHGGSAQPHADHQQRRRAEPPNENRGSVDARLPPPIPDRRYRRF